MIKKRLADGSDCRKCADAMGILESRGLWNRIDDVIWVHENDPASPGWAIAERLGIDRAPFFIVRDEHGREETYTSVLSLIRERLGADVTAQEQTSAIDVDDVGGI